MRSLIGIVVVIALTGSLHAASDVASRQADYLVSSSMEGQLPYARALRVSIGDREIVEGVAYTWWEMTVLTSEGRRFGVRMLSERVPMANSADVGEIARYIYRDEAGNVIEYRDGASGGALLPRISFREGFLPHASKCASYRDGFASTGAFMGHVLSRAARLDELESVTFDAAQVLTLRTDLILMAQSMIRGIGDQPEVMPEAVAGFPPSQETRPCTLEEYERLRQAGFNLFGVGPQQLSWAQMKPVFYISDPTFSDSFYRSNWRGGRPYLDEPMTRLGWSGELPGRPSGPEQVAEALRQRVASSLLLRDRRISLPWGVILGTLDLYYPRCPSWETEYNSAWYQLAGGASGIVHEGRYSRDRYGWDTHELFGSEGNESLDINVQMDCICAFLRGAARAHGGDWGISLYPEGDADLRVPAMLRAYNLGARYIWFWTHHPQMSYELQEQLARALMEHAQRHPRGDLGAVNNSAKVGVVLPRGYAFSWFGSWGMEREALSPGGTSYGDISAAALWEGVICSKRGIPFDFLVDEPFIRDLGYQRLVFVHTDGSVTADPPWPELRTPADLSLTLDDGPVPDIAGRVISQPDRVATRLSAITIDGNLSEWAGADWMELRNGPDAHGSRPVIDVAVDLEISREKPEWRITWDHRTETSTYMGMSLDQMDIDYEQKYHVEEFAGKGVVVTSVEPDSPADKAGIIAGDVLVEMFGSRLDFVYQIYFDILRDRQLGQGDRVPLKLKRSGWHAGQDEKDLQADAALAFDQTMLYLAARITDDVHHQMRNGWDLWREDCLQIGLDPTLERRSDGHYGEEDHEIGFALTPSGPLAWRYHGRRGQALGVNDRIRTAIARDGLLTVYEIAIPLSEVMPLSPGLWPQAGLNIVVHDFDSAYSGRLELCRWAMSRRKKTADFAFLRFEPASSEDKALAALLWRRRVIPQGGSYRVIVAVRSADGRPVEISADLYSPDLPDATRSGSRLSIPADGQAREHSLAIATESPPGRYRLSITVRDAGGRVLARDTLPVFIHPRAGDDRTR